MRFTVAHFGIPGGVISVHRPPSSRVIQTRPSSVPAQRVRGSWRDTSSAKTVPKTSTPLLSARMGPPGKPCTDGSFQLRSGEMVSHVIPPSRVRCTYWEAWYTVSGSWGDRTMGATHWNRYRRSPGGTPVATG